VQDARRNQCSQQGKCNETWRAPGHLRLANETDSFALLPAGVNGRRQNSS